MHKISLALIEAFNSGNKLFVCGNGGSATMSSHFVGEFVGKFEKERKALPAISLTADIANITAIANDYGYEFVFVRQLEALARPGDILIILSTSGQSKNCLAAKEYALSIGMGVFEFSNKQTTIGLTTADLQQEHLRLIHIIAREVEKEFCVRP